MGRFLDTVANRKFILYEEILAVEELLSKKVNGYSIYKQFEDYFLDWKLRNNYVTLDKFMLRTGLVSIISRCKEREQITIDDYIFYSEFVINLLMFEKLGCDRLGGVHIVHNIVKVLEQINYHIYKDDDNNYHIVPKDVLVSECAEVVEDTYDLGQSLFEYTYRETAGNLTKKSDILCRLYKYFETIQSKAKTYQLADMADDISYLSNKLDVRHAPNKKQKDVIDGMDKAEYEQWLDDLFKLYVSIIVLVDYRDKRKDIKELKAKMG